MAASRLSEVIAAWSPQHGVGVWWLGQAGFVLRGAAATVVIDPFVTDFGSFGRLYDPPLEPEDLDKVDLLLGTHDHADHIDPLGFPLEGFDAEPPRLKQTSLVVEHQSPV